MHPDPKSMTTAELTANCKAERRRGIAGHWTYDLGRHAAYVNELKKRKDAASNEGVGSTLLAATAAG